MSSHSRRSSARAAVSGAAGGGSGGLGQEQVAGALLCLLDGCAVHTVSLPAAAHRRRAGDAIGCSAESTFACPRPHTRVAAMPATHTWV